MNIKTSYQITIPTTNGFVGRRCSKKECGKNFKIYNSSIRDELVCPYCGSKSPIESMFTEQQASYAQDVVAEEVMEQVNDQISGMFDKLARSTSGNKFVSITHKSSPYIKKVIPAPNESEVDSEIICSECDGQFQVYGIFGYCPLCKYENIKIYDANLTIIKRDIDKAENKQGALRHAYGDIVSTFEDFCKKYAEIGTNINFQNLRNAKKYYKKNFSFDIYESLSDEEKTKIKRVFMKRHVYIHAKGIVTEEFIKEVPQDSKLLGKQAELTLDELSTGAQILRKIINNIVNNR